MAFLVSDLIIEVYLRLGVTQPGDTPAAAMVTDAFNSLNQMWESWQLEETMMPHYQGASAFALSAGSNSYALGAGGSWNTTPLVGASAVPLRAISWQARTTTGFRTGGKVLSIPAFREKVQDQLGTTSLLPSEVAASTGLLNPFLGSSNLLGVFVWPTPAASPGLVDLEFMYTMADFTSTAQDISGMSPGYLAALIWGVCRDLYTQYARVSSTTLQVVLANAQNYKQAISDLNASILGLTKVPAAQGQ